MTYAVCPNIKMHIIPGKKNQITRLQLLQKQREMQAKGTPEIDG